MTDRKGDQTVRDKNKAEPEDYVIRPVYELGATDGQSVFYIRHRRNQRIDPKDYHRYQVDPESLDPDEVIKFLGGPMRQAALEKKAALAKTEQVPENKKVVNANDSQPQTENQTFEGKTMTDETTSRNDQTDEEENLTVVKSSQRKDKKNQTDNIKWSIFTEAETKIIAGKAAKKAGLKLNEWIDRTLRNAGTAELTKKAEPPAKPEDVVTDIVKKFAEQMEAKQAATVEAQNELIRQQSEQLAKLSEKIDNQPAPPEPLTLKEMIFGRTKKS